VIIEAFKPDELRTYIDNPNTREDLSSIKASLRGNNQYRTIVVNRGTKTGRPLEVLAGNHTLLAIQALHEERPKDKRWTSVHCSMVDLDEAAAKRLVLADNKTAEGAELDDRTILRLIDGMEGDDLLATGYLDDEVDDMRALMQEEDTDADALIRAAEEGLPSSAKPTADRPADSTELPSFSHEEKPPAPDSTQPAKDGQWDETTGMGKSRSLDDMASGYEASPTRLFMITYQIEHFVWMQEQLGALGKTWDLDNNAAVMLRLVENETGNTAPALEG
jgi:hypothetical protein